MAADTWTIKAGDRETVTVGITINDVEYEATLGLSGLDASNQQDLLTSIRDYVTERRAAVLAEQKPPSVVQAAIGHNENF